MLGLVRHVPEGNWSGELAAVSSWIRRHVRYRHDPVGVELFTAPDLLAADGLRGAGAGDCDDLVALGAAMAEVLGHPTRFRVGGQKVKGAEVWSHIWRETFDKGKGRWIAYDDTAKRRPAGWSPAGRYELAGVTPAGRVDTVSSMTTMRVGMPVLDEYGQVIPGLAQMVDCSGLSSYNTMDGSLGFVKKLTRSVKRVGRSLDKTQRKTATKALGRRTVGKLKKIGRQVAPIAAAVVNVVPGVGQVASAALSVAIANDKRVQAKKAFRQQEAAAAAEEAAFLREEAAWNAEQDRIERENAMPIAMEDQPPRSGGSVVAIPEGEIPFNEELPPEPLEMVAPPSYPPSDAFAPAWPDDVEQATLGFDWGSVVNTAITAGTQAASAGAFGRRAQRAFTRYTPAIQTAQTAVAPILRRISTPTVPIVPPTQRPAPSASAFTGDGGLNLAIAAAMLFFLVRKR